MAKQKIVVVGAGYAGVSATKFMAKKLKKDDVEITLIDRHSYHTMMTELHEVASSWRTRRTRRSPIRFTAVICSSEKCFISYRYCYWYR